MLSSSSAQDKLSASVATLVDLLGAHEVTAHSAHDPVPHIFSHINMTYHVQHAVLSSDSDAPPEVKSERAAWLDADEVAAANVGTGVKKVWAGVFGAWGRFAAGKQAKPAKSAPKPKATPKARIKATPKARGGGMTQTKLSLGRKVEAESEPVKAE